MVERSLSMREAPGSIPGSSILFSSEQRILQPHKIVAHSLVHGLHYRYVAIQTPDHAAVVHLHLARRCACFFLALVAELDVRVELL